MAGKKKEGLGGLKGTTGGLRRDDRVVTTKTTFEPISIDAKNAITVIYMLQSPEESVVLRAIASLDGYGQKGEENLRLLNSLGIFKYILPLVHSNDYITKRFSQKLIGMLCSIEEFRDQMFQVENILNTFVDILEKEADMVMHEFAALTLAELSKECEGASNLLNVQNCIPTLFQRISSPDPDVQKNCLDVMNHLLNDVYGIEAFVECQNFDIKEILNLTMSRYPVIQALAFEVLKQLLSWRRDTRILYAFRDALGMETTLEVMETEEWADLHSAALDLLINVVDGPDLCDYLLQTGCLRRMINLLDTVETGPNIEKILGVLARLSQTQKGRLALFKVDMIKRFCASLHAKIDNVLESAALGIANMAQCAVCMNSIIAENPVPELLGIVISKDKSLSVRNLAAYALNILVTEDRRAAEKLIKLEKFMRLCDILVENDKFPAELCQNVIQIFTGLSAYIQFRVGVVSDTVLNAILSCIQNEGDNLKDSSVQVDALECLSGYLTETKAQIIFNSLDGPRKIVGCMKSRYASVREWAGQLVVVASQNQDFVKAFIKNEGLIWLLKEKNTQYSMPSWSSAIEAIFSAFLPAKFAYTGRLDFQDITQEGFYVFSRPRLKFILIEEYLENMFCPICPIYVVNFELPTSTNEAESVEVMSYKSGQSDAKSQQQQSSKTQDPQSLTKYMKGLSDRNSGEVYKWTGSMNTYPSVDYDDYSSIDSQYSQQFTRFLPDPYLGEYLENLKRKISDEESDYGDSNWFCVHPKLVRERARIIAEFVANEMSGAEPNPLFTRHYREKVVNEMKYQLGTTIFPLGYVRMGDHLERAVLFKVLADRVGFPCALVRGSYGRAWVEIAVPVLNVEEIEDCNSQPQTNQTKSESVLTYKKLSAMTMSKSFLTSASKYSGIDEEKFWYPKLLMEYFNAFPTNFLKPNSVVDLIDEPGRILRLNTREADEYCGKHIFQ